MNAFIARLAGDRSGAKAIVGALTSLGSDLDIKVPAVGWAIG